MLTGAQTAELCKKGGATEVGIFTSDLTVSEARIRLIDDIVKAHGHIDVLVRKLIKHVIWAAQISLPLCAHHQKSE